MNACQEREYAKAMIAHYVDFYGVSTAALARNVCSYTENSLRDAGSALIIATADHREAFYRQLSDSGSNLQRAINAGHIIFLDAHETLSRILVQGRLDSERGCALLRPMLRDLSAIGPLRVYGEMVGVLWQRGDHEAAIALEGLWNRLLAEFEFTLYCAYPIDIFDREFNTHDVDAILCTHGCVVDSHLGKELDTALEAAMNEVLEDRLTDLRPLMKGNHRPLWARVPDAQTLILWLRNNLPDDAERIISRARQHCNCM